MNSTTNQAQSPITGISSRELNYTEFEKMWDLWNKEEKLKYPELEGQIDWNLLWREFSKSV
jgi:hypothetical protein